MQTDYMICKLATERCQNNLAHICALVHLGDETENFSSLRKQLKTNIMTLIDALNCDLEAINLLIEDWVAEEESSKKKAA